MTQQEFNARVLIYVLCTAIAAFMTIGLIFGFIPAWHCELVIGEQTDLMDECLDASPIGSIFGFLVFVGIAIWHTFK